MVYSNESCLQKVLGDVLDEQRHLAEDYSKGSRDEVDSSRETCVYWMAESDDEDYRTDADYFDEEGGNALFLLTDLGEMEEIYFDDDLVGLYA